MKEVPLSQMPQPVEVLLPVGAANVNVPLARHQNAPASARITAMTRIRNSQLFTAAPPTTAKRINNTTRNHNNAISYPLSDPPAGLLGSGYRRFTGEETRNDPATDRRGG